MNRHDQIRWCLPLVRCEQQRQSTSRQNRPNLRPSSHPPIAMERGHFASDEGTLGWRYKSECSWKLTDSISPFKELINRLRHYCKRPCRVYLKRRSATWQGVLLTCTVISQSSVSANVSFLNKGDVRKVRTCWCKTLNQIAINTPQREVAKFGIVPKNHV